MDEQPLVLNQGGRTMSRRNHKAQHGKAAYLSVFVVAVIVMLMAACGGKHIDKRLTETYKDAPKWVKMGGEVYNGKEGIAFYGVGYGESKYVTYRRDKADHNARIDLSRVFRDEADALEQSYRTVIGQDGNEYAEELFGDTSELFTSMELTGAKIIDHWISPNTGVEYSLCVLRPSDLQLIVDEVSGLSAEARKVVRENAEDAFEILHKRKWQDEQKERGQH
jgi:hypothetical protein